MSVEHFRIICSWKIFSDFNEPLLCVFGKKLSLKTSFMFIIRIIYSCKWCFNSLDLLQVIAPEEIVDPNVDEHSVMTYLSQFPKAKLKPGAPLRAKTLHPKRAKAYGPGEETNTAPNSIPKVIIWNQLLLATSKKQLSAVPMFPAGKVWIFIKLTQTKHRSVPKVGLSSHAQVI